ncbi:MAG: ABC transporter substrate-binding protein [Spirochaetales bacterium]|nr:ABC transporter substrate-binding protein [Spirochaetales bacterium]
MAILGRGLSLWGIFILILGLSSCRSSSKEGVSLTIAEQYGLAYAPLQIMGHEKILEGINPRVEVNWVTLGNTAAIREAVLAGDVDAGFLGIPPFLIACDKGMPWKIATGLSQAPLGLVVSDNLIRSEQDFLEGNLLALPQPGSIQHILLTMALERRYADPFLLDKSLVAMNHPDGMNALFSGAVAGHFTSPPYLFKETDQPGYSLLMTGLDAMGGDFTFIVGMVTEEFASTRPDLYRDYLTALDRAMEFMEQNREETVEILSEAYQLEPDVLSDYLYNRGMVYSREILGLEPFMDYMARRGMISSDLRAEDVLAEVP